MQDYSQTGEQSVILEKLLKCKECGGTGGKHQSMCAGPEMNGDKRFIDIGAYHPKVFSNTRALYELGWSGIMIEPSPGPMRALLQEYGQDEHITLIQAACAMEPGLIELHVTDDAVSTSDAAQLEVWKSAGGFYGKMLVPAITLDDIFNRYGGDFAFVNLDVEGHSSDLFIELLRLGPRPKVICCEIDTGRMQEMMAKASEAGYSAKVVGGNLIVWI